MRRTVIIKKSQWDRGRREQAKNDEEQVSLYSEKHGKCCMGFYANQVLNLSDEQIKDHPDIESLNEHYQESAPWANTGIYPINDIPNIPDDARIEALNAVAAVKGIRFKLDESEEE